jgi:type IV pilus modification protein PilV
VKENTMNKSAFSRSKAAIRGFSLIEVLIAVAVLSFGLLALASLQTSLMRSSAETKAQSAALSLAKDRIEQLRTFSNMAGYRALTDVAEASAATFSMGGVDYSVWQDVTRYAYHRTNNRFQEVADTEALGAEYFNENEFKRVVVRVGWRDATGADRQLVLEDAIGAVSPENTARVASARGTTGARGPRVLIANPASEAGVIPIAIGDGSETAATNPRPRIAGNTNQSLQETSYDIYTYSALVDSSDALAQSRVETYILGCLCDTREAVSTHIAYRPSYWDGKRYVPPTRANYNPLAGPADLGRGGRADSQSPLCTECCRDHQDPQGTTGAKFSPRFSEHKHYKWDLATGRLVADADGLPIPVTSGEYNEACRVIRVDGILRVAADLYDDYFNLLKTAGNFNSPLPDGDAIGDYQDFVLEYLEEQFVAGTNYNTPLSQARADAIAEANNLNSPTLNVREGDRRWFHARGLFMDHLEPEAVSAIASAKSDCDPDDPGALSICVFKTLPFTSINLTEVAGWKPSLSGDAGFATAVVANSNFALAATQVDPVRGLLAAKSAGSTDAIAAIRRSTSALVANPSFYISPDDEPRISDAQAVTVAGPNVICSTAGLETMGSFGSVTPSDTVACASAQPSDYDGAASVTTLRVAVTFTGGTLRQSDTSIVLVGPADGKCEFTLRANGTGGNQAWPNPQSLTFSRKASDDVDCDPSIDGTWTLHVQNHRNQTATIAFNWSMTMSKSASYEISFANYAFDPTGSIYPAINAAPAAVCNHPSGGNPYSCSTNSPGATAFTLGNYNYQTSLAAQTVTCATGKNNNPTLTCNNVTARQCTNFRVASATNGDAEATVGTVSFDGKPSETTQVSFADVSDGDSIMITMEQQASTTATCMATKCTSITWSCQ